MSSRPSSSNGSSPAREREQRQKTESKGESSQTMEPLVKGKEKKKVGFVSDRPNASLSPPVNPFLSPVPSISAPEPEDYFSYTPNVDTSPWATPTGPVVNRDTWDHEQLTAALTEILQPGEQRPIARPPPVLRKQPSPDPSAEGLRSPLQSEVDAKNRADRLAIAVGSAPGSRRPSFDDGDETRPGSPTTVLIGENEKSVSTNDFGVAGGAGLRPRRNTGAREAASQLVRSHTHRKPEPVPVVHVSGNVTPVAHDLEYVPQPETYQGGVLGNLLKLYGQGTNTAADVQSAPVTPTRSPPVSAPGTPGLERPRHRLWGSHQHNSSSTLGGLIESSAMLAAPGSGAYTDKVKKDRERDRIKKAKSRRSYLFKQKDDEQFRITKHIAEIIMRHQYLVKLCRALMLYGAPTHRLEAYMAMSARVLGIEGQFLYLPGAMIISFDDSNTHTTEVKIVRAVHGIDLGRLRDVHEIYKEVVHDLIGAEEASRRLDEVMRRKPKFPVWLRVLMYGIASAAVGPFGFESRYIDLPISFLLGCIVGVLQLVVAPSNELYAHVFEISAAVLTSFLARAFGSIADGTIFCFSALAQTSVVLILPGYIVLCSSLELQSHQMIAGSVRMVYALIYTLFLGYGITIGSIVYGYIDHNAVSKVHCPVGDKWYTQKIPSEYYLLFVLPFTLCLCSVNQAKWKQLPVMLVIALSGYVITFYSSKMFDGSGILSNSLGSLCIGVLANLYSRLGRYVENWWLDIWEAHIQPRLWRLKKHAHRPMYVSDRDRDPEFQPIEKAPPRQPRKIGYGLAAAAMLPGILLLVPSALAISGSLLSGVNSADMVVRNTTTTANGTVIYGTTTTTSTPGDLSGTAFNVLISVIQVAISISVGLSLSALLVYPFGKRRSGLFAF